MNNTMIRVEVDADKVAVLTIDDPNRSVNTMNAEFRDAFSQVVDDLVARRGDLTGVILTSAKSTFFAGGDLDELRAARPEDAGQLMDQLTGLKDSMRRLETLGRPVVAAVNGSALGGGLELALAAHHRVLLDAKGVQIGFPEVTLGLLPGGGGITRTVRMIGITDALLKVLLQGQRLRPADALDAGLVDELVTAPEQLLPAAKAWVSANPDAVQPWDVKGYKIPGGTPSTPKFAMNLPAFPANLRKQLKGANFPAPRAIMAAAVEGAQVDFDTAQLVESRYLVQLATGQVAKNMISAFFFDLQHINGGGSRPEGYPKFTASKVAVLGAGMMGAGIAYVCAKAGMQVVLKDVSVEAAERGKGYSSSLVEKAVAKGRTTKESGQALLGRIHPTADLKDLDGCDLVIEAVFESTSVKHQVFAEVEPVVRPDALLGSNTSTLPITGLAEGVARAEDFIGLHFFSPVDKMPLLEIITGAKTSDAALARAFDVAEQIRKTPIVVSDSRGFFTSRVIGTFLNEAIAMVGEGVHPASVEQAGLQAGYPAAPLQLSDELNLTLMAKIAEQTREGLIADGKADQAVEHPGSALVTRMIQEFDRRGRLAGAGFYDYTDGKRTRLWPGLVQHFGGGTQLPMRDLQERMLFAEALETVKCFDEGVLHSVPDANIGSIFGIGFPAWTGGVVQYMCGYEGGLAGFVARARELAQAYGERFTPPASLVQRAERGSWT